MEFKVPQFIDIEDKIFGSFTFAQVIYVVGAGAMSYVLWEILPSFLNFIKVPLVVVVMGLALALAFYPKEKYGKPFVEILEAGFKFFFIKSKLYTWKRIPKKQIVEKEEEKPLKSISIDIPSISESKLKDISWNLDVKKEPANTKSFGEVKEKDI